MCQVWQPGRELPSAVQRWLTSQPWSLLLSLPGADSSFPGPSELHCVWLDAARLPLSQTQRLPRRWHSDSSPALPEEVLRQHAPRQPSRRRGVHVHPALMRPCSEGRTGSVPAGPHLIQQCQLELVAAVSVCTVVSSTGNCCAGRAWADLSEKHFQWR